MIFNAICPMKKSRTKVICLALPENELRTAKPNPFLENTGCPFPITWPSTNENISH